MRTVLYFETSEKPVTKEKTDVQAPDALQQSQKANVRQQRLFALNALLLLHADANGQVARHRLTHLCPRCHTSAAAGNSSKSLPSKTKLGKALVADQQTCTAPPSVAGKHRKHGSKEESERSVCARVADMHGTATHC